MPKSTKLCQSFPWYTEQRYAPQALTQALEGQELDATDDATAGLDENGRRSMYRAIEDLAKEKARSDLYSVEIITKSLWNCSNGSRRFYRALFL